jgi:hypothetical protein
MGDAMSTKWSTKMHLNPLEQRAEDLKTLADLNTRMFVAVWSKHEALSVKPKFLPVDEFATAKGFSIVPRETEKTQTRTPAAPMRIISDIE